MTLTVSAERQSVATEPAGVATSTLDLVVQMTLAQTTVLLSNRGETAGFAVLVHRLHDPVDAGIPADGLVLGIDTDDFKELVGGVLKR